MSDTTDTIAQAIYAMRDRPKVQKKFTVREKGYSGERTVFETDDEVAAERVAGEHCARRVVRNKNNG